MTPFVIGGFCRATKRALAAPPSPLSVSNRHVCTYVCATHKKYWGVCVCVYTHSASCMAPRSITPPWITQLARPLPNNYRPRVVGKSPPQSKVAGELKGRRAPTIYGLTIITRVSGRPPGDFLLSEWFFISTWPGRGRLWFSRQPICLRAARIPYLLTNEGGQRWRKWAIEKVFREDHITTKGSFNKKYKTLGLKSRRNIKKIK